MLSPLRKAWWSVEISRSKHATLYIVAPTTVDGRRPRSRVVAPTRAGPAHAHPLQYRRATLPLRELRPSEAPQVCHRGLQTAPFRAASRVAKARTMKLCRRTRSSLSAMAAAAAAGSRSEGIGGSSRSAMPAAAIVSGVTILELRPSRGRRRAAFLLWWRRSDDSLARETRSLSEPEALSSFYDVAELFGERAEALVWRCPSLLSRLRSWYGFEPRITC